MATYTHQAQGLSYDLPNEGEIWRSPNDPWQGEVYKRQGGKIIVLSERQFRGADNATVKLGSILPQFNSFREISGEALDILQNKLGHTIQQGTLQDFQTSNPQNTNESYTQGVDPNNINNAIITSNTGQVTKPTPSPITTTGEISGQGKVEPLGNQQNGTKTLRNFGLNSDAPIGSTEATHFLLGMTSAKGGSSASTAPAQPATPTVPAAGYTQTPKVADYMKSTETLLAGLLTTSKTGVDTAQAAVGTQLSTQKTASQIIKEEEDRRGLGTSRTLLRDLDKRIQDKTNILGTLKKDILSTLQNVGVTEAQLNRLYARDAEPLSNDIRKLLQERNATAQEINDAEKDVNLYANTILEADAAKLTLLKFNLENAREDFKNLDEKQTKLLTQAFKDRDDILKIGLEVAKNGGTPEQVSSVIAWSSPTDALKAATPFLQDKATWGISYIENGNLVQKNTKTGELKVLDSTLGGKNEMTPYQIASLRNQIEDNLKQNPAVKSYGELVNFGVPTVIDRFNSGTADNIADTVLMRTLAKVTDPSTGVREEEYRTFEEAQGALGRLVSLPSNWIGTGKLTDTGRAAMVREIKDRYNARLKDYNSQYEYYKNQATENGVTVPPPYQVSTIKDKNILPPANTDDEKRKIIEQIESEPSAMSTQVSDLSNSSNTGFFNRFLNVFGLGK